ncbi:hypothetical protein BDM02DRAFT_1439502 [Thelephora ganbajun]|uniref:Uncharacterized protein n=1 Tax=Thelephora ganbajun TaxID=370292 RepID=A0ACB6Z2C4_THEGA|nr:hypothetical protein BDM02DRAFT_1439502 [Thelephora ganbajun]
MASFFPSGKNHLERKQTAGTARHVGSWFSVVCERPIQLALTLLLWPDDPVVPPGPLQPHDLDRALPQLHKQQTASWPLSRQSTQPSEGAESAQEEPQEVATRTSKEPQSNLPAPQQLHRLNMSSPNFHSQLCRVLHGQEYIQSVQNLQNDDLVWLVGYLDKVRRLVTLPHSPLNPA